MIALIGQFLDHLTLECGLSPRTRAAYGSDLTDFARVAEAYGIPGLTVREKGEVEAAIEQAIHTDGPVLIDFRVVQEENVYPMVTPGKPMSDMIRRPAPAVRS